ncbi:MAG: hypothetical protein ACP5LP_03840, partial [Candidatus Micrarchaeia archaeon]
MESATTSKVIETYSNKAILFYNGRHHFEANSIKKNLEGSGFDVELVKDKGVDIILSFGGVEYRKLWQIEYFLNTYLVLEYGNNVKKEDLDKAIDALTSSGFYVAKLNSGSSE